jgi:hypothetical protein
MFDTADITAYGQSENAGEPLDWWPNRKRATLRFTPSLGKKGVVCRRPSRSSVQICKTDDFRGQVCAQYSVCQLSVWSPESNSHLQGPVRPRSRMDSRISVHPEAPGGCAGGSTFAKVRPTACSDQALLQLRHRWPHWSTCNRAVPADDCQNHLKPGQLPSEGSRRRIELSRFPTDEGREGLSFLRC